MKWNIFAKDISAYTYIVIFSNKSNDILSCPGSSRYTSVNSEHSFWEQFFLLGLPLDCSVNFKNVWLSAFGHPCYHFQLLGTLVVILPLPREARFIGWGFLSTTVSTHFMQRHNFILTIFGEKWKWHTFILKTFVGKKWKWKLAQNADKRHTWRTLIPLQREYVSSYEMLKRRSANIRRD